MRPPLSKATHEVSLKFGVPDLTHHGRMSKLERTRQDAGRGQLEMRTGEPNDFVLRCCRTPLAGGATSLRQRNRTLAEDNKRLRAENTELKDELAALLGQRRAAGPSTPRRPHTS